jgi:hypothetical protein
MQFHNPHMDIKVFRRPFLGMKLQRTYPCAATILKGDMLEMCADSSGWGEASH